MMALSTLGKYELVEKIAEGGMGAIYRGRDLETNAIVAIKVMPSHTASNEVLLKRFEQEFRAASRISHPNIVRAIDFNDSDTSPYLVMEYVEGQSLGQLLDKVGKLPESEAIRIIAQVAQGLHRAHKMNLIHRDVKPDNILITKDGVAKLADLGLVKETENDLNLTRTGRGLGTPHFMAPEQFRNAKNADARCDIYSLGATLYMMVTGELPFKSNGPLDAWMKKVQNDLPNPQKFEPEISDRIDWAIMRAMDPEPDVRANTCREFVEDLTGHSTRRVSSASTRNVAKDIWYLVYRDEDNVPHTVKGTTPAIRRSLEEGLMGDAENVRAARTKTGPFEPLRQYPEFRDLVMKLVGQSSAPVAPSTTAVPTTRSRVEPGTSSNVIPTANSPSPLINLSGRSRNADNEGSGEWFKLIAFLVFATLFGVVIAFFLFR